MKKVHPTRQRLLDVASELLETMSPDDVTVDMVLERSGISKGSLYHHFVDFQDLIEIALTEMFAVSVDHSIVALNAVFNQATDLDTFMAGLRNVAVYTHSEATRHFRFRRARLLGIAEHRPRLMAKLAITQDRLTTTFADMFHGAQQKGWLNNDFDPRAASVLIQAYTFGRIVDDVVDEPIDQQAWVDLIMKIVYRVFA